jgi:hypothetical protein
VIASMPAFQFPYETMVYDIVVKRSSEAWPVSEVWISVDLLGTDIDLDGGRGVERALDTLESQGKVVRVLERVHSEHFTENYYISDVTPASSTNAFFCERY